MANNNDIGFDFSKAVPNKFLNPDGSISTLQEILQEGGGGTPDLQDKEITINQNTTTTITADEGYDGLGEVEVTTNVQPNLQSKDVTITNNGTTTVTADEGYDGLSDVDVTVNVATGENNTKISTGFTNTYNTVAKNILNLPTIDFSDMTRANGTFKECSKLTSVSIINTYRITDMTNTFQGCKSLTTIPQMDTSNVSSMSNMFNGCTNLTTLPLLDISSVTNMSFMFSQCPNLSNDSLNNILAMCTTATSYKGEKTLKAISLSSAQAATCQTLSNWDAFVAAGWTTGY